MLKPSAEMGIPLAYSAGAAAMTNVPVHPICSWNAGVIEEEKSILLWLQYRSGLLENADEMRWSPVYLLTADKARALIDDLQKQLKTLEKLLE